MTESSVISIVSCVLFASEAAPLRVEAVIVRLGVEVRVAIEREDEVVERRREADVASCVPDCPLHFQFCYNINLFP